MTESLKYLLVTHIPFYRKGDKVVIDETWANDLFEVTKHMGPIRVLAPELQEKGQQLLWGPTSVELDENSSITFVGFPPLINRLDYWKLPWIWWIIYVEVKKAHIVHTSNLFPPYLCLLYAHNLAVKLKKKTVFVIPEDFHDMLAWEWVRLANTRLERWRRQRTLARMDRKIQQAVTHASLTLLGTPPAVNLFRLYAKNGYAFRDTTHQAKEVIGEQALEEKCREILENVPLRIVTVCRHKPLKGLDFLIRAIGELKKRDIFVTASLYGEGPMTPALKTLVAQLGVVDRVFFPGPLKPGPDVYQAFFQAHFSVMPHRTNDFARSFFDSLVGGCPVVAFSTEASEGTVRDNIDGLLAPRDNVIALSLAIERLHRNRSLLVELAKNARVRALVENRDCWHQFRANLVLELLKTSENL
jgi:glycosyltransferase involved in cell wall biosynthesis